MIVIACARGVVTHTSCVVATYARPSGAVASCRHPCLASVRRSNPHTRRSARSPIQTSRSPTVAELGPRFARPGAPGAVGSPPISVTRPVAASTTSTRPVLPPGTQSRALTAS